MIIHRIPDSIIMEGIITPITIMELIREMTGRMAVSTTATAVRARKTAVTAIVGVSPQGNGDLWTEARINGGYSDSGRQTGRRLKRSATNRMVCGVCAGIAEYFNWDPTIIRIIWVAASIFLGAGFLGVIAYFIVAVIMPER